MSKNVKSPLLIRQGQQLQTWLKTQVLPFWSNKGMNPESGGAYEQLLFNGEPDLTANQRMRVQARQTLIFCSAQQHGWVKTARL